jgi:hypothetical protein
VLLTRQIRPTSKPAQSDAAQPKAYRRAYRRTCRRQTSHSLGGPKEKLCAFIYGRLDAHGKTTSTLTSIRFTTSTLGHGEDVVSGRATRHDIPADHPPQATTDGDGDDDDDDDKNVRRVTDIAESLHCRRQPVLVNKPF